MAESEVRILKAQREADSLRRAMDEEAQQAERRAKEDERDKKAVKRLTDLKLYGRSLAADLPAGWQAKVVADLETFVTKEQFPASLNFLDAHTYVRARVQSVRDHYRDNENQRAEQERKRQQRDRLISGGDTHAMIRTLRWDREDAEAARRAVARELQAEVRSDWSVQDVKNLVEDVLDWCKGDAGQDEVDDDADDDDQDDAEDEDDADDEEEDEEEDEEDEEDS
jgi:hypothetical protein